MFASLKTWDTISQSRHVKKVVGSNITAVYAALSILYFFIQLAVLISSLDNGASTNSLIGQILHAGNIDSKNAFAFVDGELKDRPLRICPQGVAHSASSSSCPIAFPPDNAQPSGNSTLSPEAFIPKRDMTMVPVFLDGNLTSFMMLDTSAPGDLITLSADCVQTLTWPYQYIKQTRRAEVTTIFAHAFLLVVSLAALFSQSMSLVGSSLFLHVMAPGSSVVQLATFLSFQSQYKRIISSATGACAGVDVLATFSKRHLSYNIAVAVIDVVVLCLVAYLSFRLFLEYGWTQFKMAQPATPIRRGYIASLVVLVLLPLDAFFYLASSGLWLDEITSHLFGARPSSQNVILAIQVISSIFLVPWLSLAYLGIQRENTKFLIAFFSVSVLYIVGWGAMFSSMTFRQSFLLWPFMSILFVISYILIIATIALTALCSFTFGIGVPDYLNGHHNAVLLEGSRCASPLSSDDIEKLTLRNVEGDFTVKLPSEDKLENPPQRSDSKSSYREKKLMLLERSHSSRMPIAAAQPGMIKIRPPTAAVTATKSLTGSISRSTTMSKSSWKYKNDNSFWGRSKRHESAMSFGHLDASRLEASYTEKSVLSSSDSSVVSGNTGSSPAGVQPGLQPPTSFTLGRNPKMDSVGSLSSTQSNKLRLYLVTEV